MKVSGMKCKLFVEDSATGKLLAGQRNATLSRSAESVDSTSKDSEGFWTESIQGFKSWSIDADGAYVTDDESFGILEAAFVAGENVNVYLEMPSSTKYKGEATITTIDLDVPFDDLVTYSLSLTGSGTLVVERAI